MDNNVRGDIMSGFSDFVLISNEVLKWLSYEFAVFGTTVSIMQVFFSCALLSLTISMVVRMFIGGGD